MCGILRTFPAYPKVHRAGSDSKLIYTLVRPLG